MNPLLDIRDLHVRFVTDEGVAPAVDGVSLSVDSGETLGVVGESGCGKSVTALSILGIVPSPPGEVHRGEILFRGRDLLKLPPEELRRVRGNEIAMIFQEPMTSLNPVFTVGDQIGEAIRWHESVPAAEARRRVIEALRVVELPEPERRVDDYPHQLSGGMRQRVMIAMALVLEPALLIADEPTTALDVTIQAQILDLLRRLREELGMSVLLITHDLGIVAEQADRVAIFYAGRVVEEAPVAAIFEHPSHPYTRGLLAAVPKIGERGKPLVAIPGRVPRLTNLPSGCRFRDRCPIAKDDCAHIDPSLERMGPGHRAACWRAEPYA